MRGILAGFCITFLASVSFGGTVSFNFDDGTLDGLSQSIASTGFSASVSGGTLQLSKAAGDSSNGGIYVFTAFAVTGDFTAAVDAHYSDLSNGGSMSLALGDAGIALAEVYFAGGAQVQGRIYGNVNAFNAINDSTSSVIFEIQRTGDTVTESYNPGSGFVQVLSSTDTSLSSPVNITLDLQRYSGASNANSGSFDDLTISSPSIAAAPLPSVAWGGLVLFAALGIFRRMPGL